MPGPSDLSLCPATTVAAVQPLSRSRSHEPGARRPADVDVLAGFRFVEEAVRRLELPRRRRAIPAAHRPRVERADVHQIPALLVGRLAAQHTYWALPVACTDPDGLARLLWALGIDASRSASSMHVVAPPPGFPVAAGAAAVVDRLIYLPLHPALEGPALRRLTSMIDAFERGRS